MIRVVRASGSPDTSPPTPAYATFDTAALSVTRCRAVSQVSPNEFSLEQNYPNPFNPSTTINFDIPNDGHVRLKVYNYIGQEVITLVDDTKQAGKYQIQWDAAGLASGVYFYRLQSDQFTETKKMVLMR